MRPVRTEEQSAPTPSVSNHLDSSPLESNNASSDPPELSNIGPNHQDRTPLSNRELDALRFVVQGLANKEIASQMEISESAVKNTLQQLFAKTEVRTRGQLVRVALERYRDLL
jgi:DNA-binding NarL/FixJ family response regulator